MRRRSCERNPHLDEVIIAPRTRGARRIAGRPAAGAAAAARAVRPRAGPARRPAQRVADLGERRRGTHRLRHQGTRLDVHADRRSRARAAAAALGARISGICSRRSRDGPGGAADADARPDRDGARPGRRRADGGRGWRAAGVAPDDELVVMHVSAGNPFRRWPEAFFAETAAALAAGNSRRRLVFSSGPSDREAASRIAADTRARLGAARRPYHRPRRIRPAGAQSADRPEPAVRRRRHGAAAHRRVHGHAGRRHLRADAGGALGPVAARARSRRCPSKGGRRICPAVPAISGSCVHGDFRCLTQLTAGPGDRGRGAGTVSAWRGAT